MLKIYQMNDADWVIAEDPESAKKYYLELVMSTAETSISKDFHELTEGELDTLKYFPGDDEVIFFESTLVRGALPTFREALEIFGPSLPKVPFMFASVDI